MRGYFISQLKFFVVIALGIWGLGANTYYKETTIYSKWDHVEGEILDIKRYTKIKKNKERPVYDFSVSYTYQNESKIIKKTAFSGIPRFKVGDDYPVRINPLKPEEVRVSVGGAMGFVRFTVILGSIAFLLGLLGFFLDRKKE